VLVETRVRGLTFFLLLRSVLAGLAIGLVTPAKVGEVTKALFIPSDRRARIVGLVLVDRYFDLLLLMFLAVFGVLHFWGGKGGFLLLMGGMAGTAVLPALRATARKGFFPENSPHFFVAKGVEMLRAVEGVTLCVLLKVFVLTAAFMLLSVSASYCMLRSLTPVPFLAALNVFPLVLLSNVLPVTFGNLGVREGLTIYLLSTYGVRSEVSLNVALSVFVLHSLVPSALGAVFLLLRERKETARGQPGEKPHDLDGIGGNNEGSEGGRKE
jgi:uncharacterized membrane protein YbhN (UPF0104 family)